MRGMTALPVIVNGGFRNEYTGGSAFTIDSCRNKHSGPKRVVAVLDGCFNHRRTRCRVDRRIYRGHRSAETTIAVRRYLDRNAGTDVYRRHIGFGYLDLGFDRICSKQRCTHGRGRYKFSYVDLALPDTSRK